MADEYHIVEINRALARHDVNALYTLLCEIFPRGMAGRALYELIKTQHDWPTSEKEDAIEFEQILTPQELEVLRYADEGLSRDETARQIPLSPHTVNAHRKHIYTKLGAHNIADAIRMARERGLLK